MHILSYVSLFICPLQENRLLISDPKALQYIFHTSGECTQYEFIRATTLRNSGYGFQKWPERTEISRVLMGRGLLWADGKLNSSFYLADLHVAKR